MRRLIIAASVLAVSSTTFCFGFIVALKKIPPYQQLIALKKNYLDGGDHDPNKVHPEFMQTRVKDLVKLGSTQEVAKKRSELISLLWGRKIVPHELPIVEKDIVDDRFKGFENLRRIDKISCEMEFGFESICYHFVAERRTGQLLIYHQGHRGGFELGEHFIKAFVKNGFDVVGMAMPCTGLNNSPVVELPRFGSIIIDSHDKMSLLNNGVGHPFKIFLEPVIRVVNYARTLGYEQIAMAGISGGGWTTVLSAAVDPRIQYSYAVSGSLPIYLRVGKGGYSWGDYEQTDPQFYRVANYLELYVLAATGNGENSHQHTQVINRYDPSCFSGIGYTTYEAHVVDSVSKCGKGSFNILVDETHREHKISAFAIEHILAELSL